MTSLLLEDREKQLFNDWLEQREKYLLDEISILKSLKSKLLDAPEASKTTDPLPVNSSLEKKTVTKKEDDFSSWVNIIKNEMKHFTYPVPSGEIVKRLLDKPSMTQKGKRFITKAVTSKLWLLQERGEVIKTRENGKYVYSLKR